MTDRDPQTVARGLTKAQREQIRRGVIGGDCSMRTARSLIDKGLMHLRIDSPDGRHGFIECTPLGLQVRALLEKEGVG